jgi:hypothetical protein
VSLYALYPYGNNSVNRHGRLVLATGVCGIVRHRWLGGSGESARAMNGGFAA